MRTGLILFERFLINADLPALTARVFASSADTAKSVVVSGLLLQERSGHGQNRFGSEEPLEGGDQGQEISRSEASLLTLLGTPQDVRDFASLP